MASAFVGRSRELAALDEAPAGSLVTLWGPGGVGKTRLASEHAARERRRGRSVVWADLASARTRREAVASIASALGVALSVSEERGPGDSIAKSIARAAAAQRVLLVLDNLEQLDAPARDAITTLAAIVRAEAEARPTERGARVLATSRELVGAPGEIAITVGPLDEEEALVLFESLAGEVLSRHDVTRSIVRRLDALPLAIELAAARVPLLGVTELLARLDRKLDVLGTARADRPARHATLRAAIAWSWELLDEGERDALVACASFEAPFDAALAEAVIGGEEAEALDRLERLRGRALVHTATDERGRPTLRLLESVRDFAREASAAGMASGEDAESAAGARFSRHAAAVLQRSEPLAEAARCGRDMLGELEALRTDLMAVLRRSRGTRKARAALALAALLAISGPATDALDIIDEAMTSSAASSSQTDEETVMRARLLVAKGDAMRALGRLADAREGLAMAVGLADGLPVEVEGARLVGAEARRVLGSVLRALGHVDEALAHKSAALATYRALGDRAREGICLGEIGAVHQSEGRLALAKTFHAQAIAIHTGEGCRRAEGVERSYLAVATHRAGDVAAAIALHESALAIHREVGHRRLEGAELLHLGFVHHELGSVAAARRAFVDARRVLAAAGARGLEAITLVFAARLEVDEGDATTALLQLAEASQVAPPSWPRVAATRHLVEGHLAMVNGAPARACASYEAALATSRDLEVGFEALTPAYLAVAIAHHDADARAAIDAHIAEARAAVGTLENPSLRVALEVLEAVACGRAPPDVPASASVASSEVRRALLRSRVERSVAIDDGGKRVVLPDGRSVDLSRRKNVRLVLLALARARRDAPGTIVPPDALLEAGWPGEKMRADAATKRLHTAIWTLRKLGLEGVIVTEGEGYLLDERVALRFND